LVPGNCAESECGEVDALNRPIWYEFGSLPGR
jgi:hypothetical protein